MKVLEFCLFRHCLCCVDAKFMTLSLLVMDEATTMENAFKGVLQTKLHWYRSILLFRIDLYLFAYLFRFILRFSLAQGQTYLFCNMYCALKGSQLLKSNIMFGFRN